MKLTKQQKKEDRAIVAIIEALGFDPEKIVDSERNMKLKDGWFDINDHTDFRSFLKHVAEVHCK